MDTTRHGVRQTLRRDESGGRAWCRLTADVICIAHESPGCFWWWVVWTGNGRGTQGDVAHEATSSHYLRSCASGVGAVSGFVFSNSRRSEGMLPVWVGDVLETGEVEWH